MPILPGLLADGSWRAATPPPSTDGEMALFNMDRSFAGFMEPSSGAEPPLILAGPTATLTPLTLQTTDDDTTNPVFQALSSTGGTLARLTAAGAFGIGTATPSAKLHAKATSPAEIGLNVELAAGHAANAFEINAVGGVGGGIFCVGPTGVAKFSNGTAAAPTIVFEGSGSTTGWSYEGPGAIQFSSMGTKMWQTDNQGIRGVANGGPHMRTNVVASATVPVWAIRADIGTGLGSNAIGQVSLICNSKEAMRLDQAGAAPGETSMLLHDVDTGLMQRVSVGSADSGGAGFKVLRIPN